MALFEPSTQTVVEWDESFLDLGSSNYQEWRKRISEAVPPIHFSSLNSATGYNSGLKIATVEIRKIEFFEYNDQVVFTAKMDIFAYGDTSVKKQQIGAAIYQGLSGYSDPEYSDEKVARK
jgi:hypothetical protein